MLVKLALSEWAAMDEFNELRGQQRQGRARAPRDGFNDFPGQECYQKPLETGWSPPREL